MVSLAKLLLNFILEKCYVLIEMLLVLFKIATQIHFTYHVQAQTIDLQLSQKIIIQALLKSEKLREILNTPNLELPRI